MGYTIQTGLGDTLSDLITKGGPAIQAASKVISDPALPEITCHILRLNNVVAGKNPGPPCPRTAYSPAQKRQGVGMHLATKPLRAAVWARRHPAVAIGIGVGVVGLFVGIGYAMGKRK